MKRLNDTNIQIDLRQKQSYMYLNTNKIIHESKDIYFIHVPLSQ